MTYPFALSPKVGATVLAFQLEREIKPRKHYKGAKIKKCKYTVEAIGKLEGKLGEKPAEITTKKTLEFASKELTMKSSKECEYVMDAVKPPKKSDAKPLAAPKTIQLRTAEHPLAAGAPIEAASSNLEFETSAGRLECVESTLDGTVTANNSNPDTVTFTKAEVEGTLLRECQSTTPLGSVSVEAIGLPWVAAIGVKQPGELKNADGFTVEGEDGLKCTFTAPKPELELHQHPPPVPRRLPSNHRYSRSAREPA